MIKKIDETNRKIKEHIGLLGRLWNVALNHFFTTFFIIFIINIVLISLRKSVPDYVVIASFFVLIFYVVLFLIYRIRANINRLIHHELKFKEIVTGYVSSVIFIIVLMSILYWGVTVLGVGYLRYGSCVDNVNITRDVIMSDPLRVSELLQYSYFSATTFFTVGFGDICPMGYAKFLTVMDALIGNAFTVLILAMAITNYTSSKDNKK